MPIGLGLASSHAPGLYSPANNLVAGMNRVIKMSVDRNIPIPQAAYKVTEEELETHWKQYRQNFATLRQQVERYNPDVIIIIGGDQNEVFDKGNKVNALIFTGEESYGSNPFSGAASRLGDTSIDMTKADHQVRYKTDVPLAKFLANELVSKEGFDLAVSEQFKPMAGRGVPGLPHAFVNVFEIFPNLNIPTVLIYENTYDPPAYISAKRCYDLGSAIARIMAKENKRVAILGSGGLSHDPGGPMHLWIDQALDKWVMNHLASGTAKELSSLWQVDSMTMRGGTGEIRAWITVAGAMETMGSKATIVDYCPHLELQTGVSFAYWLPSRN